MTEICTQGCLLDNAYIALAQSPLTTSLVLQLARDNPLGSGAAHLLHRDFQAAPQR